MACVTKYIYATNHSNFVTAPSKHNVSTVAKAGPPLAANTKNA